jgi:endoglucanase
MIRLRRGVNLSHWFSQSERRGEARRAWTTREDIGRIRAMGFDHIRLPLDEEQLWNADGTRDQDAWDLLESALDWAKSEDLRTVCDLHILRSHHFNDTRTPTLYSDPAELERFCGLWRELAGTLGSRPADDVALEILNEAVARDPADWNRVSGRAFQEIRQSAPDHTIVLGSNWYCMCETFPELSIPEDRNQILTFHFYNPMCITHYGADWTPGGAWRGPVRYPGKPWPNGIPEDVPEPLRSRMEKANIPWDRERMQDELSAPVARSHETGLPLFCGEFGVYERAAMELRLDWLSDAVRSFEEHGIAWAVWDWKGSFGVVDGEGKPTGIHRALLG